MKQSNSSQIKFLTKASGTVANANVSKKESFVSVTSGGGLTRSQQQTQSMRQMLSFEDGKLIQPTGHNAPSKTKSMIFSS